MYQAKIYVTLKESVLDPQGKTVKNALESLSFKDVASVRQGKYFVIKLDLDDEEGASKEIEEICRKLLVNTVIETYKFDIEKI
ncbi:MAG: phosphoribosylformylglycinamidine synthase subunit PurS [Candidatus Aureabacteria bacterium]|nr:phosphoribosylformylglycinamidine synthase subunit PurS [Candidatus Auribacterota bacterium]